MKVLSRFWHFLITVFSPAIWKKRWSKRDRIQNKKTGAKAADAALTEQGETVSAPAVVRQYEEHPSEAYMELKYRYRDIGRMGAIAETMGRDFLTAMPEGAWKARLGQIAFLHRRMHDDITNENVRRLIDKAKNHHANNGEDWDIWDAANLREMEKMYDRHAPVSNEMTEKRARLAYEGRRRHRDALADGDWPAAREFLSSIVDMNQQVAEARCKATGANSLYQALMEEYMPSISVLDVEDWFGTMNKNLTKMLPKIMDRQADDPAVLPIEDFYPAKAQMWLNHALLESIGFDFRRGGLFETGHNPVEGGTPDDTRLVIKNVDISNFTDSMKSALHEGGHGIYIQGLPRKTWRYQPVGQDMGAAVQESQALIIEMIIARTRSFFDFLSPRVEGLFHGLHNPKLSPANLYLLKTRVKPSVMRKKADEVTYFFHMQHRFNLERDLIEGKLKPSDLPEAWNNGLRDLLDVQPEGVRDGCLQDVHWFVGKFGYFPSYTVGHMMAAQLFEKIKEDMPHIDESIANGDFTKVTSWLGQNIHAKGRLLDFDGLVNAATGKSLTPKSLLKHIESRYLAA